MNLEGGQLFCPTEGKGPHQGPGYYYHHCFSLEVVMFLILVHRCRALSGFIVDTKKNEEKSNFLFVIRAGGFG